MFKICSLAILTEKTFTKPKMSNFQLHMYHHAAIACNSQVSADIGIDILKKGGSAADAAIAVMLSEGVCCPQSTGIGGGCLMVIYNRQKGSCEVLNSRECAPKNSHKDMYSTNRNRDISTGGLAVAVPGELKGYWELHRKYGKLEWKELFAPTIKHCRTGIPVSRYTMNGLARLQQSIELSKEFTELFTNKKTGKTLQEGEMMYRPKLADTLTAVALKGPDALYDGELTHGFIEDIEENGGIITKEDLKEFKPMWQEAISVKLEPDLTLYSTPPPGAGHILFTIVLGISKLITNDTKLLWHRIIELWKYSFGLKSKGGGPYMGKNNKFTFNQTLVANIVKSVNDVKTATDPLHYAGGPQPENKGTCHVCVLAENGDAISVTSSINDGLGAAFFSKHTGIILNNHMMDFSIPFFFPWDINEKNLIEPLKQPNSSMCPTIIINNSTQTVNMLVGGTGGFRILTSVSQVIIRKLFMRHNLLEAVSFPRLHHQLVPMRIEFEEDFDDDILKFLMKKGHGIRQVKTKPAKDDKQVLPILPGVNAIAVDGKTIQACSDARRFGNTAGY